MVLLQPPAQSKQSYQVIIECVRKCPRGEVQLKRQAIHVPTENVAILFPQLFWPGIVVQANRLRAPPFPLFKKGQVSKLELGLAGTAMPRRQPLVMDKTSSM